jgi:AcrR family transcriptional regulator
LPRPKEVTDAQIISAARKVFLEQGTQTPVAVIAQELGVSPATLFVRMGSKRRLISAALWPPDPTVLDTLERGFAKTGAIHSQVMDILVQLAEYVDAEIPATFTLYAAGLRARPNEDFSDVTPARLRRGLTKWLQGAVKAGELKCDPRIASELILGTLEARGMHAFIARRPHPPRATRAFLRKMAQAVLALPPRGVSADV